MGVSIRWAWGGSVYIMWFSIYIRWGGSVLGGVGQYILCGSVY